MTIKQWDQIEPYLEGIKSGKIKEPKTCRKCRLFAGDCIICCHPPVTDLDKRPNWCPFENGE